jgi:hypothetical protein
MQIKVGDIVKLKKNAFGGRVGLVKANDKSWWVIKNHLDVDNCIVAISDIEKVVRKNAVPKKYLSLLK